MRPSLPRLAALAAAALLAACGGKKSPPTPPLKWTWVDIPGSVCSDGSSTGIGVEASPTPGANVLVFLMGGGACWDAITCFPQTFGIPFQIATPGPYGEAQMKADVQRLVPGSIFDRTIAANPFKDFTFVFVPYCTGDVHAGDAVRDYTGEGAPRPWHFKGRVNLAADLSWIAANLEAPGKVVISGSSAGGFGALLAFDVARKAWPSAQGYLIDDSGPPLSNIPPLTVAAWYATWNLEPMLTPLCGLQCATDLSLTFPALQARYPRDRLALLSSTQDLTIRGFFGSFTTSYPWVIPMDATTFETALRQLEANIKDAEPPGETYAFIVPGTTHPMLDKPGNFSSQGVTLFEWLRREVEDDPAWSAAIPP